MIIIWTFSLLGMAIFFFSLPIDINIRMVGFLSFTLIMVCLSYNDMKLYDRSKK